MKTIISKTAISNRDKWVQSLQELSGVFRNDTDKLEKALHAEITEEGMASLVNHLRLCGDIPESYGHDSSEEKLYSKYTDVLLCESFKSIGLKSIVLKERSDAADVEGYAKEYSFVADAKAFRLSRTAKNQKDFKVQAMDKWKRGKTYAMVVCPIYQLPTKSSQIYEQASSRNVCIFTYSHLAVLVRFAELAGNSKALALLQAIFNAVTALNPSKDSSLYWSAVNRTMLDSCDTISELWKAEKQAAIEAIAIAKEKALACLSKEREKIMRLSHEDALMALIKVHKIESRMDTIQSVCHNTILNNR